MKKVIIFLLSASVFSCFSGINSYAATVNVTINNYLFQPQSTTINAGDTVTWTNQGGSHTTTSGINCSPDGKWDSGTLSVGQSYSYTFNTAGTYPYFCTPHCASGMTGTIIVNSSSSSMTAPASQQIFTYTPNSSPFTSTDASQAKPIGIGSIATGGNTLSIYISMLQFSSAVDIYFGVSIPSDPNNIYLLKSDNTLQTFSTGMVKWKANTTGPVSESLFGDISTSLLPSGTYALYLLAAPTGSLDSYYLWITSFIIGAAK